MSLKPLREMMKELVQLKILTEDQVRESTVNLPRDENMIVGCLQRMADKQYLTPYQVERLKFLDYQSLVLGGNKLLYENAAGSFARVFRGANIQTGQTVAIKILRNRWADDEDTVVLFKREAEVGKKLKHHNIVPIYDIGFDNGQHFFTMEFVEGGNLKDFIKIRGKLKPAEAVRYVIDIAKGLEYAISLGYTHRDLKPTNVLLSTQGVAKLIDFGLAATEEAMKKVGGEAFINALEYNTLEKGTGAPRNDPRSDLFFMGVIFYELISGIAPYEGTADRNERKRLGRYTGIRPLIQVAPDCPKMIAAIVDRLLHANPIERYQSATEILKDLKMVQGKLGEVDTFNAPVTNRRLELPYKKSSSDSSMTNSPLNQNLTRNSSSDSGSSNSSNLKAEVENEESVIMLPVNSPGEQDSSETLINSNISQDTTLLFLESREKEQGIIKEYFRKHGFKVLIHADPDKFLARIKAKPPTVTIIMGEGLNQEIWSYIPLFKAVTTKVNCPLMVIAGKQQRHDHFPPVSDAQFCLQYQPVTLRDMRKAISQFIKQSMSESDVKQDYMQEIKNMKSDEIDVTKLWE